MTVSTLTEPTGAPPTTPGRPGVALTLICVAMFMLMLDMTIVAVALPDIQADLHADLADLQWVVDAYTLPLAALLLTAATLGDRFGRRRLFSAGMAIFTIGSLACALAADPLMLNTMRALQGVGAAMLFGTAMPILGHAYPDIKARAKAIGAFGATLAGATAVGPLLGGFIVDNAGWQWIFAINVPIGIVAFIGARIGLPESKAEKARRVDVAGTVLLTISLAALVFGLIRGQSEGWGSALIVASFAVAALTLLAFVLRAARGDQPMVDLELFRRPGFVAIGVTGFVVAGTLVAATNYVGLYFVNTLGYTPFEAGLRFLPLTVTSFIAAPVFAQLSHRIPTIITITGSLAVVTGGLWWASQVDAKSDWTALAPGFILAGIGLGASSAILSSAALASVEPDRAGMATGVVNTMRQIGTAAGVAALGALFAGRTGSRMASDVAPAHLPAAQLGQLQDAIASGAGRLVADHAPAQFRAQLTHAAVDSTAYGIHTILLVAAMIAGAATLVVAALLARARRAEPAAQ
ncbi:putative drug resistance transporter [Flexivirga endophytica]|uniref:Drug resistance transporter n=1 Tax=Flexivirga endophytica TaxID=1849103 RepID=A0A916T5F5_9MICO|nr:DHA2 family efflux MFS transporter permease subunit [Flexivirga endophytica]GGB32346.1 putative drug resistance transporter [Flexivirga endophytica]GHB53230.1 putative drug resistance transporter [Flexivirga endophytica]